MAAKELRELRAALKAQNFKCYTTTKQHLMVTDAKGRPITTISGSPSDWRSWRNALGHLKRAGLIWPPKKR